MWESRVRGLMAVAFALMLMMVTSGGAQAAAAAAQAGPPGAAPPASAGGAWADLLTPNADPGPAPVGPFGVDVKRPIIAGACPHCPWGSLAEKVKQAMKPAGYDVQVCYNCSGLETVGLVSERRRPVPLTPRQVSLGSKTPPDGPVDFGVTLEDFLIEGYHGRDRFASGPPRSNLRLIANIEDPSYHLVAVRQESLITDLAQIKANKLPAVIVTDSSARSMAVLAHYGIVKAELESWGGKIIGLADPARDSFTVIMGFTNGLNNTPESNTLYVASQRANLKFIQLPDALVERLVSETWFVGEAPVQLFRGMDKPIRTVVQSGTVVYGRDDLPESFTYAVAKALDEQKAVLKWSVNAFSYEPGDVWKAGDVPLHPGAARYYRERGYMPAAAALRRR